jgi:hypothetical protein
MTISLAIIDDQMWFFSATKPARLLEIIKIAAKPVATYLCIATGFADGGVVRNEGMGSGQSPLVGCSF